MSSKLGANYDSEWSRTYPVRLVRALFLDGVTKPLVKTLVPPTVHGLDRIANAPVPAIFAANHSSHLDTPILTSHLPDRYRHKTVIGAGADYFFDRAWKAALWSGLLGAIPIERTKVNRKSGELAESLLQGGWSLIIFPEGGRSPDGFGQAFKGGVAQLAKKTGVPIIPVYIKGTYDVLGKNSNRLKPAPTAINFGYPLHPRPEVSARELTMAVRSAVDELAHELSSDWWTARRAAAQGETPSLTRPDELIWIDEWNRSNGSSPSKHPSKWPRSGN